MFGQESCEGHGESSGVSGLGRCCSGLEARVRNGTSTAGTGHGWGWEVSRNGCWCERLLGVLYT